MGMAADIEAGIGMAREDCPHLVRVFQVEKRLQGVIIQITRWIAVKHGSIERTMSEKNSNMPGMLGQRGLQKSQGFACQHRLAIADDIQHDTEHLALNPVIARRLLPESGEILQQVLLALWSGGEQFVISNTRIKWHLAQVETQLLARQLIIFGITHLDQVPWRDTEGRRAL